MSSTEAAVGSESLFATSTRKISSTRVDVGIAGPAARKGPGGTDNQGRTFTSPTA